MHGAGGRVRRRSGASVAGALLFAGLLVGCGGGGSDADATTTSAAPGTSVGGASSTAAPGSSSTDAPAAVTTTSAPGGLPGASEAEASAPGDGTGTALLKAVRVGRHEGYERIVFEFVGSSMPGYRVGWVEPPITADGSGETVEVDGDAFLQIVFQPASGVDLSAPELTIVYTGPDRVSVTGQTRFITDLVRTGDFEAVLSWVAGTTARAPFRVQTLTSPTRVAIDIEVP